MQVWAKVLNILVIVKAINFHSQYVCSKINLKATALLQELTSTYLLTSLTLLENTPTIYRIKYLNISLTAKQTNIHRPNFTNLFKELSRQIMTTYR